MFDLSMDKVAVDCVIQTVLVTFPAVMVIVAVRSFVPLFSVTVMLTVLLPVPEVVLTLHQETLLVAVHSVFEVTLNDKLPPAGLTDSAVWLTAKDIGVCNTFIVRFMRYCLFSEFIAEITTSP